MRNYTRRARNRRGRRTVNREIRALGVLIFLNRARYDRNLPVVKRLGLV